MTSAERAQRAIEAKLHPKFIKRSKSQNSLGKNPPRGNKFKARRGRK